MTLPPESRRTRGALAVLAVVVLVLATTVAVLAFRLGATSGSAAGAAPTPTVTPSASSSPALGDVATQVAQSVVVVRTADGALGAGVVASADGSILTANHVVADGSAVTVVFADGTRSTATVASSDTTTDIATLTPASFPEVLVPATIGGGAHVGADVVAIGNPLGLAYSVSTGVVSGLDRTATTDVGKLAGLIQFDASVNPGSSGGPLLDAQGVVVGIVVAIADPGDDDAFAGIGFAVPIAGALGGQGDGAAPQV